MHTKNRPRDKKKKPIKKHREGYKGRRVANTMSIKPKITEQANDLISFLRERFKI